MSLRVSFVKLFFSYRIFFFCVCSREMRAFGISSSSFLHSYLGFTLKNDGHSLGAKRTYGHAHIGNKVLRDHPYLCT